MVGSRFLYFLKVSGRAADAMRACRLAHKVLSSSLRLEHGAAKSAPRIIPDPPLAPRVVFVQPADLFFRVHDFQFRIKTEFIFKQSRPPPRFARGQAGNCLTVTTGRIAAAWTNLLPLFAACSAPCGAGSYRLQIKCGVRRYRRHSGRTQGVRLTPLGVVLDGVSFLFAADLPKRGRPTRKA